MECLELVELAAVSPSKYITVGSLSSALGWAPAGRVVRGGQRREGGHRGPHGQRQELADRGAVPPGGAAPGRHHAGWLQPAGHGAPGAAPARTLPCTLLPYLDLLLPWPASVGLQSILFPKHLRHARSDSKSALLHRTCAAASRPSRRSPSCSAGPSAATWTPTTSTRTMRSGPRLSASTSRRGPLAEPQTRRRGMLQCSVHKYVRKGFFPPA